jgi:hypothetical protein
VANVCLAHYLIRAKGILSRPPTVVNKNFGAA